MIALLTDFGHTDIYVGVMKGVIYTIHRQARIVDVTHDIQPQNVRQGAFALLNSYHYFPKGTVFLVVVDPGVGTERKPIIAYDGQYTFVAPDNGVLSYVLHEASGAAMVVEIQNREYFLSDVSATFHGRDIFAPVAANLAAGAPLERMGRRLAEPFMLPLPALSVMDRQISGEIVHIDHFGNLLTSIGELRWIKPGRLALNPRLSSAAPVPINTETATTQIGQQEFANLYRTYDEVGRGDVLALVGSNGYLEIAVNQGNAAARLDAKIGDSVEVNLGPLPVTGKLAGKL
jgi:hypothetical protein